MLVRRGSKVHLVPLLAAVALAPWMTPRMVAAQVEKGIVVLVEFPDVKHSVDMQAVRNRFAVQLNNYVSTYTNRF